MLWTCGAWSKILWCVPIVYWPVTMTMLWWLPFWYPGCTRLCLKIDFSRTVNWYHLHSDSDRALKTLRFKLLILNQHGLRYWGQDSHSPTLPACYKQGIVFYIWERDLGGGAYYVWGAGCMRGSTVAKSGQAEILKLLFWTGIFEILAKTLLTQMPCRLRVCYKARPNNQLDRIVFQFITRSWYQFFFLKYQIEGFWISINPK